MSYCNIVYGGGWRKQPTKSTGKEMAQLQIFTMKFFTPTEKEDSSPPEPVRWKEFVEKDKAWHHFGVKKPT